MYIRRLEGGEVVAMYIRRIEGGEVAMYCILGG